MADTILIVDDEESVRRTFADWLTEADLGCTVRVAGDAEEALRHAQNTPIDLAVLDWNLGTGMDGLRLLEDLAVFCPDVVAILVTGYAAQATPLMALRMGVRDYLDKNHELTRGTFVNAVKKQLALIRPAKQQRAHAAFRAAVEKILPLVQASAALNEPAPLPRAAAALCGLVQTATNAGEVVLLIRHDDTLRAWSARGEPLEVTAGPFAASLMAGAVGMSEPCILNKLDDEATAGVSLQPFERNRQNVLVAPLTASAGISAALELFDKPAPGFTDNDRRLAAAAAAVGTEMLAQALAERSTQQTLFAAVDAALKATEQVSPTAALPPDVRASLQSHVDRRAAPETLELAEAIQALSAKYGTTAVKHCLMLIRSVGNLLDEAAG